MSWAGHAELLPPMPIPESQLQTWSHQGAAQAAETTYRSIRTALEAYQWPPDISYDLYLQGSYRNSTNIRGDSDVDIVLELESTFHLDVDTLSISQQQEVRDSYPGADYRWTAFREDTLQALREYYGSQFVRPGNKAINVTSSSGRLDADIVVCLTERHYTSTTRWDPGIVFWTTRDNRRIINFPKLHYDHGVAKSGLTHQRFKKTVRHVQERENLA